MVGKTYFIARFISKKLYSNKALSLRLNLKYK